MISRQKKRFEVAKEIIDKQLYELGEEVAHRHQYTPEPIDMINLDGLDYILFLDRQLYNQYQCEINKLMDKIEDLSLHYKEVRDFRDGLLKDMEGKAHQFENDCYESANRQEEVQ